MPVHPKVAESLSEVGGSLYSSLMHRLAAYEGEVFPLHVGDTLLEPAEGCRMQDLRVEDHPGMHRYADPRGMLALLDAIADRLGGRTGVPTERGDVLVTAGATGALGAVIGAIVVSWAIDLGQYVHVLGTVPNGLPHLGLPLHH